MTHWRWLPLLMFPGAACAQSFDFDDCMLNGLRGVASDSAASMIKRACESKREAAGRHAKAALASEYGAAMPAAAIEQLLDVYPPGPDGSGRTVVKVMNKSNGTLTYLRMRAGTGSDGLCWDASQSQYHLVLPPGSTAFLRLPADTAIAPPICIAVGYVRARESSLADHWRSMSVKTIDPTTKDIFAGEPNRDLPTFRTSQPRSAPGATSSLLDPTSSFMKLVEEALQGKK
jgi:hypothetical protein